MGRKPTGRPTSFDIAYAAGVSQPTVSRALRGDRSVSQATREKIKQIARDLNYTVDKNASSLRSQRSNTIALLFFEDPTPDESMINPFFLAMLGSITRACADRGLDLLISFQRMEDDWHVQYQDSHRADGLIKRRLHLVPLQDGYKQEAFRGRWMRWCGTSLSKRFYLQRATARARRRMPARAGVHQPTASNWY